MWCVDRPTEGALDTFNLCISKVREIDLKGRLSSISHIIAEESSNYEVFASNAELYRVIQSISIDGTVSRNEMVTVYNSRMVRGPGRSVYDAIKLLPKHGRCPFCDHRDVSTLDHILPKALYPQLAVSPLNLVGSCKDCNKAKLSDAPTNESDSVLHPYFDNLSDHEWLVANVVEQNVCAIVFSVRHRAEWSEPLNTRLMSQFNNLKLSNLYSQQAAREMSEIRENLIRIFASGPEGTEAVKRELRYQYGSRRNYDLNSWKTALYKALSESDWYCSGGFRLTS